MLGDSSWMPYAPQGVKGTDDDKFPFHQYTNFKNTEALDLR
jgi:hypothetical protein